MKLKLALLIFLVGAGCFTASFYVASLPWNSALIGLATNLVAIALGIVIVNQYLEGSSRKAAVKSLFILSEQSVASFHNRWVELCWAKLGRDQYGLIGDEYFRSGGKPEVLKEESRRAIYDVYTTNPEIQDLIRKLEEALTELSRLAGWSLDPDMLAESLKARTSISKLFSTTLDGSLKAVTSVTEHMFDIEFHTGGTRERLMELAGISDD